MAFSKEQLALQAHIEAQNKQSKEKIEAEGGSFVFSTVSDPEHWAGYGIFNIEQYRHYEAQSLHTDIYKDINGLKPRWMPYEDMSTDEILDDVERISHQAQINENQEQEQEKFFEKNQKAAREGVSNKPFAGLKKMFDPPSP